MSATTFSRRLRGEEPEWVVVLTLAVALAIGWFLMATVTGRSHTATAGAVSLAYPAGWAQVKEEGASFAATDLKSGVFGARVSTREVPKSQLVATASAASTMSLSDLAGAWSLRRGVDLSAYRVLKTERTQLRGREAVTVTYAYLAEGRQGAASRIVPRVMQGTDTLVAGKDQLFILSFAIESGEFANSAGLQQRLLDGWVVP
jgi:hypothetical protein